jgi:pimeloyl-ACP methyl ester carboxylesterase
MAKMEKARSKDGTPIAFERRGSGKPLILVGGALSDRASAALLASVLETGFAVFSYDRRGRGDSGDSESCSIEHEVEDLASLIDAAGGSAFVFGHSSGAALALESAARGLPIERLALYEPPFIVDGARELPPEGYEARLESLIGSGRAGEAVRYFLTVAVQVPEATVARMEASPMWRGMEAMARSLLHDQAVMEGKMTGTAIREGAWSSVGMPTLVIDGGASPTWIRNSAAMLAKSLPKGRYRSLEGQTHGADPAVLAPVLAEFFSAWKE